MKWIREILPYVIIVLAVVLIRSFIITPVRVDGPSMNTTLADGQILLLNKTIHTYNRMDIVVFKYKNDKLIKRVIGLPGETVEIKDNKLYINNNLVDDYASFVETADFKLSSIGYDKIPEGYYFVMGDNRYDSTDSRIIGLVSANDIEGKVTTRLFPLNVIGKIK